MKRKLAKWLVSYMVAGSTVLISGCVAGAVLDGVFRSFKPETVFNVNNPYLNPCTILRCGEAEAAGTGAGGDQQQAQQ